MTNPVLRGWFREQVDGLIPEAPYKETLNAIPALKTDPKTTLWTTIEFENAVSTRQSLGTKQVLFREVGQVNIVVLGLSGKGDSIVTGVATRIADHFREYRGQLTITGTIAAYYEIGEPSPPDTAPTEDGNWFMCVVSCPYKLDVYRDV